MHISVNLGYLVTEVLKQMPADKRESTLDVLANDTVDELLKAVHLASQKYFFDLISQSNVSAEVVNILRLQMLAVCSITQEMIAQGDAYITSGGNHPLLKPAVQDEHGLDTE